jgi:hypothetical protein
MSVHVVILDYASHGQQIGAQVTEPVNQGFPRRLSNTLNLPSGLLDVQAIRATMNSTNALIFGND